MPPLTAIERDLVANVFFTDSYRVAVANRDASVVDLFFAVLGHHPLWLKTILLLRHRVGSWFGLNAAARAEIMHPTQAATSRVGDTIGAWQIYFLGATELVAGRDNKHVDFRLSVLKQEVDRTPCAVFSTVCRAHNRFGRVYLRVVAPFHKWGMQRLMRKALRAGRL